MRNYCTVTATVFLSFLLLASQQAEADCAFQGSFVSCTGTDSDGFEDDTADLTVSVQPGATVTDNGDAIKVEAAGLYVINNGTINSDDSDAIQSFSGLSVNNMSLISGGDEGITADDPPENPYTNIYVLNTGTIRGIDDAIKVGARSTIINFGLIENIGTDASDPQDAIDIDSGVIINHATGVIRSTLDAAIDFDESEDYAFISNSGTIVGTIGVLTDAGNAGNQEVVNTGQIEGTSGVAMDLSRGQDSVSLLVGGSFIGDILLGDNRDIFTLGAGSFGDMSADFVVNGGDGSRDTIIFSGFGLQHRRDVTEVAPDVYEISISSDSSDAVIRFTEFERFTMSAGAFKFTMTLEQLREGGGFPK